MEDPVYRVGQGMEMVGLGEEDTVICDLNAEDIIAELQQTFIQLRERLTVDGRLAQVDEHHPFVRLVFRYNHDDREFSTALLVLRGYCYSYSFYANGRWFNVGDSKYNLEENNGRKIVKHRSYTSGYTTEDTKTVGLSNLAKAVMSLDRNDRRNWGYSYRHLIFVFIESARLTPIADYFVRVYTLHVNACIHGCNHTDQDLSQLSRPLAIQAMCGVCREKLFDLLQSEIYNIEDEPYVFRKNWGNLSDALTKEGPGWSLNESIADQLGLPSGEGTEDEQRNLVTDYVRIVKPPRLRQ